MGNCLENSIVSCYIVHHVLWYYNLDHSIRFCSSILCKILACATRFGARLCCRRGQPREAARRGLHPRGPQRCLQASQAGYLSTVNRKRQYSYWYIWVVVKILVPFLGPSRTRHLVFPKGEHNFDNHPYPDYRNWYLDSQVAGNYRPLYPKVDHYWFKVAHNYEPLALQVIFVKPHKSRVVAWLSPQPGFQ